MSASNLPDRWLVRTEKNIISGPFPIEKIREMIASRQLGHQDEVCGAGVYWIFLHETEEVRKQLGVTLPRRNLSGEDEEDTQTGSSSSTLILAEGAGTHSATSNGGSGQNSSYERPAAMGAAPESDLPEMAEEVGTENTAVLSNRAFRQFRTKTPSAPPSEPAPAVTPEEVLPDEPLRADWERVAIFLVFFIVAVLIGAIIFLRFRLSSPS